MSISDSKWWVKSTGNAQHEPASDKKYFLNWFGEFRPIFETLFWGAWRSSMIGFFFVNLPKFLLDLFNWISMSHLPANGSNQRWKLRDTFEEKNELVVLVLPIFERPKTRLHQMFFLWGNMSYGKNSFWLQLWFLKICNQAIFYLLKHWVFGQK